MTLYYHGLSILCWFSYMEYVAVIGLNKYEYINTSWKHGPNYITYSITLTSGFIRVSWI